MNCSSGNEISASEAIQHMQLRLAAGQVSAIDEQKKTFPDTDKMIEHMRRRLNASFQPHSKNVL